MQGAHWMVQACPSKFPPLGMAQNNIFQGDMFDLEWAFLKAQITSPWLDVQRVAAWSVSAHEMGVQLQAADANGDLPWGVVFDTFEEMAAVLVAALKKLTVAERTLTQQKVLTHSLPAQPVGGGQVFHGNDWFRILTTAEVRGADQTLANVGQLRVLLPGCYVDAERQTPVFTAAANLVAGFTSGGAPVLTLQPMQIGTMVVAHTQATVVQRWDYAPEASRITAVVFRRAKDGQQQFEMLFKISWKAAMPFFKIAVGSSCDADAALSAVATLAGSMSNSVVDVVTRAVAESVDSACGDVLSLLDNTRFAWLPTGEAEAERTLRISEIGRLLRARRGDGRGAGEKDTESSVKEMAELSADADFRQLQAVIELMPISDDNVVRMITEMIRAKHGAGLRIIAGKKLKALPSAFKPW